MPKTPTKRKTTTKKATSKKPAVAVKRKRKYYEAVGRRKTAVARIRIMQDTNVDFVVNEKSVDQYFQGKQQQIVAQQSLEKGMAEKSFAVSVKVRGGGMMAQAEAVRQGIARALVKSDGELRSRLKALGYLTRDPRTRERKKFGLKRARRARQWRKR